MLLQVADANGNGVTVATSGGDHQPGNSVRPEPSSALALSDRPAEADALRQLALRLQQAVVPPASLPAAGPGVEIAARCRPARDGLFSDGVTGTVVCARYTPARRELRWARAGHLPPVLVRGGIATVQPLPDGMLLGVRPEEPYQQLRLRLDRGDTVLLLTDGLIERRAVSISDALAEFAAAASPVGADLDRHVARVLAAAASDTGDDACLLAARVG
jgi:hypothetical protein